MIEIRWSTDEIVDGTFGSCSAVSVSMGLTISLGIAGRAARALAFLVFSGALTFADNGLGAARLSIQRPSEAVFVPISLPAGSSPLGITAGPDGNLWIAEYDRDRIGRLGPTGTLDEFWLPFSRPSIIVPGPDGALWFTTSSSFRNQIGKVTTAGAFTALYDIPTPLSDPSGLTVGPDGNLWFAELTGNKIARLTPAGDFTEFPLPTSHSEPAGICRGPDGNLWFTEFEGDRIGRITPGGAISEFPLASGSAPADIAAGPDGNLWFTEHGSLPGTGNKIGRITPSGAIAEFALPTAGSQPLAITTGSDGNLWFTESAAPRVGRITPAGSILEFQLPFNDRPQYITSGPDGNLWFTTRGDRVVKVVIATTPVTLQRFTIE